MARPRIDLASSIRGDSTSTNGTPVDFPVCMRPLYYDAELSYEPIAGRVAVVREDTGQTLAVVSDSYTLVPHRRLLDAVEGAIKGLNVGPAPCGIYVDRHGARLRALYKFPALEQPVRDCDAICPCVKLQNTYDGTSRITVHIGAFRFVCTNLAVGGGGLFAGGFMAVHQGEIPIAEVEKQLSEYLADFDRLVALYRYWQHVPIGANQLEELLEPLPKRPAAAVRERVTGMTLPRVYDAYNAATYHATHRMRSYHGAFDLLERVNGSFQRRFPLEREADKDPRQVRLALTRRNGNGSPAMRS